MPIASRFHARRPGDAEEKAPRRPVDGGEEPGDGGKDR